MRRESVSVEAASTLNKLVGLVGFQAMHLHASQVGVVDKPQSSMHLTLDEVRWTRHAKTVFALYGVQVSVKSGETTLVELRAATRATYALTEELTDEQLLALPDFLGIVGWMQVWPYLRADVSELALKLGHAPVTLPVLLLGRTNRIALVEEPASVASAPAEPARAGLANSDSPRADV